MPSGAKKGLSHEGSRSFTQDSAALGDQEYAYVAYRIGDGADAEDVTSETFARALRYRESFDPRKGDAVSWLVGIARRCIAAYFAERQDAAAEVPEVRDPCDLAEESLQRLELAAAIATLDERDRELVSLRYGADMSAKQIAEVLEMRVNTVEVALHRALRRLREALEGKPLPERTAPARREALEL